MGELQAYAALLRAQVRSVASYRTSFVVELLSNIGATALDVLTVVVLFGAARVVGGFTLREAVLIVALSACGFALADFAVGSFDRLKTYSKAIGSPPCLADRQVPSSDPSSPRVVGTESLTDPMAGAIRALDKARRRDIRDIHGDGDPSGKNLI